MRTLKKLAIYINARLAGEPHAAARIIARGLSLDPWSEIDLAELATFALGCIVIAIAIYITLINL